MGTPHRPVSARFGAEAVLDAIPHGVAVVDTDGVVVQSNRAACTLLGLSREQLVGRSLFDPMWDAVNADGRALETAEHPALVAIRTALPCNDFVMGVRREDRSIVWLGIDAEPLIDAETEQVGQVVLTFADVGHRRATERALRTLSKGNAVLIHSPDEVTLLREMCRTIVRSGQYALAWVGVGEDDDERSVRIMASAGATEYLYDGMVTWADDHPRGRGPTGTAIRTGEIQLAADLMVQRNYDTWRARAIDHGFGSSLAIPMTFPFRGRAALTIYAPDARAFDAPSVALLKELAEELAFGIDQLRMRTLRRAWSDASPLSKIVLDHAGTVVEHNPATVRFVGGLDGVGGDDDPGATAAVVRAFLPVLDRVVPAAVRADVRHEAWTQLRLGVDTEVQIADGTARPIRIWAAPIVDAAGEHLGTLVAGQDLTEVRVLEARIRQSQKMESIGTLAGGIAHDFNNVLTVMLVTTEVLLAESDLPPSVRTGLETVMQAGESAAMLTRQLLAFSRRRVMQPELVDLNVIVTSACRMLERLISADVSLTTQLDERPVQAFIDPAQIEQVLINFVVNASQALPNGGAITVRTMAEYRNGDDQAQEEARDEARVAFSVADNGSGIPAEDRAQIFDPFFTTKPSGLGTGLGLATADGIIRECGGQILLESTLGAGSTFTVVLPAAGDAG